MNRSIGIAVALFCVAAPAAAQGKRKIVEVPLPLAGSAAATRITLAAANNGFMIASSENGVITLAPYEIPGIRPPVMLTIRVNLVPSDSTTIALVGGSWSNASIANLQKTSALARAWNSEGAAEEGGKGFIGTAFKEVERFAAALKTTQ